MKKCDPRAYVACIYKSSCGQMGDVYYAEGSECEQFNEQIISRPRTNADRIRSMSDEELAGFLEGDYGNMMPGTALLWLQQPAEGGGGDDGTD